MNTAIGRMTGVNISSAYFTNSTTLELFPKHPKPPRNNRVALVYGRNGTGKSTIAQGFREYRDKINTRTVNLTLMEENSLINASSSQNLSKIFVFDEEYVSSRVKIQDSGLDAIVLFGEQVALEEQIREIEEGINTARIALSHQETQCAKFVNNSDVNSPEYWRTQIRNKLREPDGWAEFGSKIKGQKQNLSVTDSEIERIGNIFPTKPLADLHSEMRHCYAQFSAVNEHSSQLSAKIVMINTMNDINSIIESSKILLRKIVERPRLTEREQRLLDLFGIHGVSTAKAFLSDTEKSICEKCLQPINGEYRTKVLGEIECILNRDIEDLKSELKELLLPEVLTDLYHMYRVLPSYDSACNCLSDYNRAVKMHNDVVNAKIDSPFDTFVYDDSIGILEASDSVNQALTTLESDRIIFNRIINERPTVRNELLALNDACAHYSVESMFISLNEQQTAQESAERLLQQFKSNLTTFESKKALLDSQRKNFHIAAEEINKSLAYIFFSFGRLSLILGEDQMYHLKANGNPINPNKVSCGERNALALCYFFTEIAKDMDAGSIYSDEVFLVIDDPVSSFDLENRIGVLSFLRWKFEQVLKGCATTKILMMTHDISVMFDMAKALQEIATHCKNMSMSAEYRLWQLDNKVMSEFLYREHNEYTQLLQRVFQYASAPTIDIDSDLVIGNIIRRVLEAFATFSYKKGIDNISTDERVLEILSDETIKTYYRNLMYRLLLHGESHFEESMRGVPEISFFSHLSPDERQRTAKDVLCFIYRLNKPHLLSHLPNAEQSLDAWCANAIGIAIT